MGLLPPHITRHKKGYYNTMLGRYVVHKSAVAYYDKLLKETPDVPVTKEVPPVQKEVRGWRSYGTGIFEPPKCDS